MSQVAAKTYANKSNARRAAKQAGLATFAIFEAPEGGFYFEATDAQTEADQAAKETEAKDWLAEEAGTEVAQEPTREDNEAELAAMAEAEQEAPAPVAPAPAPAAGTYAALKSTVRSKVLNPVGFVHKFLDEKGKGLTRKQAVAALVDAGVNYSTARTQYQRWFEGQ